MNCLRILRRLRRVRTGEPGARAEALLLRAVLDLTEQLRVLSGKLEAVELSVSEVSDLLRSTAKASNPPTQPAPLQVSNGEEKSIAQSVETSPPRTSTDSASRAEPARATAVDDEGRLELVCQKLIEQLDAEGGGSPLATVDGLNHWLAK